MRRTRMLNASSHPIAIIRVLYTKCETACYEQMTSSIQIVLKKRLPLYSITLTVLGQSHLI